MFNICLFYCAVITIPKHPNSDNLNLIFHVTSWYVVRPSISRTSCYLVLLGISYFLVFRTSWYLVLSGSWYLVFPYPFLPLEIQQRSSTYVFYCALKTIVVLSRIKTHRFFCLLCNKKTWFFICAIKHRFVVFPQLLRLGFLFLPDTASSSLTHPTHPPHHLTPRKIRKRQHNISHTHTHLRRHKITHTITQANTHLR